ncbi:hypothetical protein [uncultured Aureimonas sp.]|uniref:hypothetical protein n=1 Tax=uncultured Aureimonas sp. TaxID=1604662 RepID=UPI0025D5B0CA|nr:hypothetical protein [uncultured Aureimonas sp.]
MTKGIIAAARLPGVFGTSMAFATTPLAARDGPDSGVRTGTAIRIVLDIGDSGLGRTTDTRGRAGRSRRARSRC